MSVTASTHGDWTILILPPRLDHEGAGALKAALEPLLGRSIAIDFSAVEYVTSYGFRVLMQTEKEQRTKGGRLLLGNLTAPVMRFFEIAGLNQLFKFAPDLRTALAANS